MSGANVQQGTNRNLAYQRWYILKKGDAYVGNWIKQESANHSPDGGLRRFAAMRRREEKHNLQQTEA